MHTDPTSDQPKVQKQTLSLTANAEEIICTNNIFIDNIEITCRAFSDQTRRLFALPYLATTMCS